MPLASILRRLCTGTPGIICPLALGFRAVAIRPLIPAVRSAVGYPFVWGPVPNETQIRFKITTNQIIRRPPFKRKRRNKFRMLEGKPMRKGVVTRLIVVKPKKPNSAQRKMCKVMLKNGREVICAIPGIGHNLREHSEVIIRAGRTQDCPGVKYKVIRGLLDCQGVVGRITSRSKYGTKKPKQKA